MGLGLEIDPLNSSR